MSTQVIPQQVIITCDCCKVTCTRSFGPGRRVAEGRVTVKQHALDFQGSACADGTVTFDLCDSCLSAVSKAINDTAQAIRAAAVIGESK